jgi:uncharacterized protein YdeI (YjbR/CyaY-like superfamily)
MEPRFFRSSTDFRKWLEKNHTLRTEILVGFYKKDSGKANMTWAQSVDEALCFGWIDGVRKRIDELSYTIRFTPRKPKSIWSAINIKRAAELTELGLMYPVGLKAFNARDEKRSVIYAYENTPKELDAVSLKQLRANKKAWAFFQKQAPWYQRTSTHWVLSAKREETRAKRLGILIEDSANGLKIATLRWNDKTKK